MNAEDMRKGPAAQHEFSGTERLVFFSDAVFAIVITLLVLPLAAEFEAPTEAASLAPVVGDQWPRLLSFVVSFLVIGQFWVAHHTMFEHIDQRDHPLLWFNLVFLLTISFQPFPTAVLGARLDSGDQFPVVFYAASMAVSSLALTVTWLYARFRGLTRTTASTTELRLFTARALSTSAVFLGSIVVALAGLLAATTCWLVMLPVVRHLAARRVRSVAATRRGPEREGVLDA